MLTRKSNLFTAILTGIVGIVLIIMHNRIDLFNWISIALGLMFILPSLYVICGSAARKEPLPSGMTFVAVGGIILGILMCVFPSVFAGFFVYIFAAILVVTGISHIFTLASWSKQIHFPGFYYVIPTLLVIAGVTILSTSLRDINRLVVLITGIALVASAVNTLLEIYSTRKSAVTKVEE